MTEPGGCHWYTLDDNNQLVGPCSLIEYAEWMDSGGGAERRQLALDITEHYSVSTVFLGLDHSRVTRIGAPPAEPLTFETMIFRADGGIVGQTRYSTYDDALAGHRLDVGRIKIIEAKAMARVNLLRENVHADKE